MKELSIIIVSFNTRNILKDCLDSVFSNTSSISFEVIVIDNASSDNSVDMIKEEFPQVKLIENFDNKGFAAANNQGFKIASGKYWLLLNSDTVILGNVLEKSFEYMERNSAVGMMGCRVLNKDKSVQDTCFMWPSLLNIAILSTGLGRVFPRSRFFKRERMRGWRRNTEREVDAITGCYLFVRSSATLKIGVLDEDFFFYGEETDWCLRFSQAGYEVKFAPVGDIIHLGGASGEAMHYSRKIMLSQALVRLQRKHNGFCAAVISWVLLLFECVVKSLGFGLGSLIKFKKFYPEFNKYFRALLHFDKAWAGKSKNDKKSLLAVSSSGGHWMQLRRLEQVFDNYNTIYASTKSDCREGVLGSRFMKIVDVNRWKKIDIPYACLHMLYVILRVKPDVILTTGALPGLLAIVLGRVTGSQCIWVDSIANSEELSMSGKVAGKFAHLWLTQWEHLAGDSSDKSKPEYAGKIL